MSTFDLVVPQKLSNETLILEDDEEYYYDEEEEEDPPPRRKRPNKKRKPSRKPFRKPNRRLDNGYRENEENNERVPFLVPLMMVPESEIGVDKKFSFSGDQLSQPPNQQQRPNQLVSPYQNRRGPGQQKFNNRPFNNCKILIYPHARLSFPQACFTR